MLKSDTFPLNQPFFSGRKKNKKHSLILWKHYFSVIDIYIYYYLNWKSLFLLNQHPLKVWKDLFLWCLLPRSTLRFCANCSRVSSFLLPPSLIMILNTGLFFGRDEDASLAYVTSTLMWLVFVSGLSSVVNKLLSISSAELKGLPCTLILSRIANFLFAMWSRLLSFWLVISNLV